MKVFVSSTVYDLLDVRAEVADHLRSMGITPVMSDDKTSGFEVTNNTNSIQTCLVNIESCDEVIAILDKRYGPSLGKRGFADVSATHLEMRYARQKGVSLRVYVRDRLEADFATWKRNKENKNLKLPWISEHGSRLTELLDEFSYLKSDNTPNWYTTFRNSRDLKVDLTKAFGPQLLNSRLTELISANKFPLLSATLKAERLPAARNTQRLSLSLQMKTATLSPALHVVARWCAEGQDPIKLSVLAPGDEISMFGIVSIDPRSVYQSELQVEYYSALGIKVEDRFEVSAKIAADKVVPNCQQIERKFFQVELPEFTIRNSER